MHLIHSNNNYKVICRLRPQENRSSMLEISENNIIIKDPSNRASSEKQLFNFSSVFDELSQQELLFKYVCDHALTKIIEGHNSCVLSYGQTGSGKSFTIFGEDERYSSNLINFYKERKTDRKGLVPKTIEYLFKRGKELEEIREFVISCSMVEIYLDQVRDLGRSYSEKFLENRHGDGGITSNGFDTENLEIVENTNGQIQVKNVSQVVIKTMEDLFVFLDHGV